MKNMNEKSKKRMIIAGGILISVVLIFMIGTRLQKELVNDVPVQNAGAGTSEAIVDGSNTTESTEKEEVILPPIEVTESPSDGNGGDDTGTEQTIQADIPEKPIYTEEQLADTAQKPNGEKVDPPKDEDTTPSTGTAQTIEPKPSGGLPGFDSVPDGGANQVIEATDMYENGNKIGEMD